jgi:hypothetical protein
MIRSLAVLLGLLLAGCAPHMKKVDTGELTVGDRLLLTIEGPWNHINAPNLGPAQTWTMEGLPVDTLLVYSGVKDDEFIHPDRSGGQKAFKFQSAMQPDQIVAMFEGMLTRDGSSFKLVKLEPASFGGEKGFRFEYSLIRRVDNVQLAGLGYAAVSKGELFALLYSAPRLTFFSRHQGRVDQIARSARLKM